MFSVKFFLAVLAVAAASMLIQWFFIGFLFHKYQAQTPATWRKESTRSYAASTLLSLFFAFMFVLLFFMYRDSCDGTIDIAGGIEIAVVFWLAFSVTTEIGSAIYVNYSRMFVVGKCISSLVEYITAGIIAAAILYHS